MPAVKDSALRDALAPLVAAAALFVLAFAVRPLIPLDETRYASVAWEMHLRGDWLVPHLNGAPYSHKPPLLFWLILSGWSVLGVSELWMRAVPALLTLVNVVLVARLARRLWPADRVCQALAPWIFAAAGLPALFGTVLFFDPLLTCCVLVGVDAILRAAQGSRRWLFVYAAAIGCGVLSKGPVVLVHALPVALLAPWWAPEPLRVRRAAWYAQVTAAVSLGLLIGLAWALPAAHAGGAVYHAELLWDQTADRMVKSFAHRRPFWFYIPQVLLALVPWTLWPPFYRAWRTLRGAPVDHGVRSCLAWFLPGLVVLSLVSGKQPQYLLPLLPAVALAWSRALSGLARTSRASRAARLAPVVTLAGVGALLVAASAGRLVGVAPAWTAQIPAWGGGVLLAGAALLLVWPARDFTAEVPRLALASLGFLFVVHAAAVPRITATHDLRGAATLVKRLQSEGHPVAHVGTYHGQFQFLGRLTRPLAIIEPGRITQWARAHPDGSVVIYPEAWPAAGMPGPAYVAPHRGKTLTIWPAAVIVAADDAGTTPWK